MTNMSNMPKDLISQYKKARAAATPLIAISTPDPVETVATIQGSMKNGTSTVPLMRWDCIGGAIGLNDNGAIVLQEICQGNPPNEVINPTDILVFAEKAREKSVFFLMNAHRYFDGNEDNKQFIQALCNLRDVFKSKFCTIVLLGPAFTLPAELKQDVLVLDQPFPTETELRDMVVRITKHNNVPLENTAVDKTVDALRGLAAFPAEQTISMELTKTGIDPDGVWERKAAIINANDGMSVWRGGAKFDDLGGLDPAKEFFQDYINGLAPLRLIAFVDEIEKSAIGGGQNDSNGLGADIVGQMCTKMQDNGWTGSLFFGHAGTGKTQLAKVIGNQAEVPTIYIDFGAMFGGIVGDTQRTSRNVFKTLEAMGGDGVLWIATCNEMSLLKPEIKRRFGLPTFFFDLLTDTERMAVKRIYCKKYGFDIKSFAKVNDAGWTGAEIERCCKLAHDLRTTPDKTAKYIVPIAQSSAADIQRRRAEANGKFLSASTEGIYTMESNPLPVFNIDATKQRKVELE
jgi:ATPase family associated with various cellular activities (AAA)